MRIFEVAMRRTPPLPSGFYHGSTIKLALRKNKNGQVIYNNHLEFRSKTATKIPGDIDRVGGTFRISESPLLTSLEGCPQIIGGAFYLMEPHSLKNLEGGPKKVIGVCDVNGSIKSLKGSPEIVGSFDCSYTDITSLVGGPTTVKGSYICRGTAIKNLVGSPRIIPKIFTCSENPTLVSLEGIPDSIGERFVCKNTGLRSLKGSPREILHFDISNNTNLSSLEGMPERINGRFVCQNINLSYYDFRTILFDVKHIENFVSSNKQVNKAINDFYHGGRKPARAFEVLELLKDMSKITTASKI